MKKADYYLKLINNVDIDADEVRTIIKQIQEDAIKETVKECAENILLDEFRDNKWVATYMVYGTSQGLIKPRKENIFLVADKLIKEL